MKVLIDATDIIKPTDKHKSIPIWLLRILNTIPKDKKSDFSLLITPGMFDFFKGNYPGFNVLTFSPNGAIFPSPSYLAYLKSAYKLKKILRENNFDCLFLQGGLAKYLFFRHKEKVIVVEHDMKAVKDREPGWEGLYKLYINRRTARKSYGYVDKIMAISEYTKKDILTLFPKLKADKIAVVYNSVVLSMRSNKPQDLHVDNYILYVNTLQEYKNVATLIKAYNLIKDSVSLPLVLVGKNTAYWENAMIPYVNNNGFKERIIRLEGVSDSELRYLYEHATLFVTPSTHEGFGYTPIEAAMCECPVVSSKCEALPETTRGLLNYYEPACDEQALANKIIEVLHSKPAASKLKKIAEEYRFAYSPELQYNHIFNMMCEECGIHTI